MSRGLGVAIGSLGTVGVALARRLVEGVEGLELAAVSARDGRRARARLDALGSDAPVLPLEELAGAAQVVVECAPAAVFERIARPVVAAGRTLVPISVGALLSHMDLVARARETGAQILVPSGAILGLDALRAAGEGEIRSVRMVTRKPPGGLAGAPYLDQQGLDVSNLEAPLKVFEGNAADGARAFPANVNVAAAVGLAGIGPQRTALDVWADPDVTRNEHTIHVDADSASFELRIQNVPTEENPRTGRIVAHSVVATLRRLAAPLCVGT